MTFPQRPARYQSKRSIRTSARCWVSARSREIELARDRPRAVMAVASRGQRAIRSELTVEQRKPDVGQGAPADIVREEGGIRIDAVQGNQIAGPEQLVGGLSDQAAT
jgi:hypothetical protein